MLNARSLYNKPDNFKDLLHQIGPDLLLASETWERKRKPLTKILPSSQYKIISYARDNNRSGGGCAIFYSENRFEVLNLEILAPEGVEIVWALFTPKIGNPNTRRVKRIAVGSVYVSPNSQFKSATIDHIIETIHCLRSRYDNEVNFLIGGDFNRLNISSILDAYGALKQSVSVPTRNGAVLEIVLSDLHTLYHPPTTLNPLQVDEDKNGVNSDHNIVVLAPLSNADYQIERVKKSVKTRPLPESTIFEFENDLISHDWSEVVNCPRIDEKVEQFHKYITATVNKHFPEKTVKISNLDKKWFSPKLKSMHRRMQREFFRKRKSPKWKKLKAKFKKEKRKSIKQFYSEFVTDLKNQILGNGLPWLRELGHWIK